MFIEDEIKPTKEELRDRRRIASMMLAALLTNERTKDLPHQMLIKEAVLTTDLLLEELKK